jgi:predicted ATPase
MGLTVLTGACGAGKTTIARAFVERHPDLAEVHFFDRIGVPSVAQMVADYGSPEEWQRLKTIEWFEMLAARLPSTRNILFEGQMRLSFIREAQRVAGIEKLCIVLVDCDEATRERRLIQDRSQPELFCEQMMNWARFLRNEAEREGAMILDTSHLSVDQAVDSVRACFS